MIAELLTYLTLSMSTDLSYYPNGGLQMTDNTNIVNEWIVSKHERPFTGQFEFAANLKGFEVGVGLVSGFFANSGLPGKMSPSYNRYIFHTSYEYKAFQIGYAHECAHPMAPVIRVVTDRFGATTPLTEQEYFYDRLFIKVKIDYKPFK